jgi:ArsR family transcriptional regulator, arsenate/arsenite/antimonite-responsive transcriptional repressor
MKIDPLLFAKTIADETRQELLRILCCEWLSVNELVERLDGRVNQPTVSHHLKKLEEANLVNVRQEGRQRFYTVDQETMALCCCIIVERFAPQYDAQIVPVEEIG